MKSGLASRAAPLDRRSASHLLSRTSFGAGPNEIQQLVGASADQVVDSLVDEALAKPLPERPAWFDSGLPRRDDAAREAYVNQLNPAWLNETYDDLIRGLVDDGLRDRLALFWHNHFVTEVGTYFLAPIAARYVELLRGYALGNFKDFVHAVGLDQAMLIYLNGTQNQVTAPNENYARELLELFTMGQLDGQGNENYTQEDIEEIARALTGWVVDIRNLTVQFVSIFHDLGDKTILGRTGSWGYDDVVDILFEERGAQIAEFITRKLYREFVYETPDEEFVAELAGVFQENDFEIAPVVRAILKSEHFYDGAVTGALIKSPVAMVIGLVRQTNTHPSPAQYAILDRATRLVGQRLLDPPNVAGWEGHRTWIDTTTLPSRWVTGELLILARRDVVPQLDLVGISESLLADAPGGPIDPNTTTSVFSLPALLASHLIPVPIEDLDLSPPSDGFAGNLELHPIPDEVINGPPHEMHLAQIFLQGAFPWYEWRLDLPDAESILKLYVRFLVQQPEFQLT